MKTINPLLMESQNILKSINCLKINCFDAFNSLF